MVRVEVWYGMVWLTGVADLYSHTRDQVIQLALKCIGSDRLNSDSPP